MNLWIMFQLEISNLLYDIRQKYNANVSTAFEKSFKDKIYYSCGWKLNKDGGKKVADEPCEN